MKKTPSPEQAFIGSVMGKDLIDLVGKSRNYKLGGTQKIR